MVKEMVLKESRQMPEMHQQNQQVLTLKKIIMDNRKVQEKNEKETQDLRDQLQAMQGRMAALGTEDAHHKEKQLQEENDKELAQAIKISEQATAAHDTHQPTTPPLPAPASATPPPPSPTPKAAASPSERASERDEDDNTD